MAQSSKLDEEKQNILHELHTFSQHANALAVWLAKHKMPPPSDRPIQIHECSADSAIA